VSSRPVEVNGGAGALVLDAQQRLIRGHRCGAARRAPLRVASARRRKTYVAVVQVDDGVENPIPDLPEYQELQEASRAGSPSRPNGQSLTVVGSYRLF
jgi:hypothetical protein